ncbi:hypothetical protein IIV25_145R [Invertebrate iridovirus 25]|uniref:Uncharacterized protein n=1 Tax=Invertebrate iridovirus 25 TaxID=1301280 RepID=W8W1M3_9VIRU|nr:hypothetical protein IIV25_145R [Invertebrate iridovirus 25]CCV02163.1 hypothetical protein IIV25_145R [Invertebrate iridovirus 25]
MTQIPMDVEVVVDHFYVFDNVAVFPVKSAIDHFPKFQQTINNSGYSFATNHRVIFAAVTSDHLITASTFDSLPLFGCAILNIQTRSIDYFKVENESKVIKSRLLDVITHNVHGDIFIDMYTNNPNFDVDATFFVKYGFIEPILINKVIRLKYVSRPSTKLTLMQIRSAVSSLKSNVLIIDMFIPKVVATTLSKCLKEINEASGILSIVKYINNGVALIGLNSDNIQSGDEGSVALPDKYSPFVFHTHPDHITREFKAFISWPSGQDMMVVTLSFLQFRDQLVHFVASPEGLWSIHITPEFQRLLVTLRTKNSYPCSQSILDAIHKVFTQFESPRLAKEIEAIDRYNIGGQYLSATKNYKLSNLVADVPQLRQDCNSEVSDDAQLFNVSLIKWKRFSETADEGVYLTFDYISDIPGGLSPFFFPSF